MTLEWVPRTVQYTETHTKLLRTFTCEIDDPAAYMACIKFYLKALTHDPVFGCILEEDRHNLDLKHLDRVSAQPYG